MGLFKRINKGLKKTRDSMSGAINAALHGKNEIDDEFYEELEEILVMSDVGVNTATEIVDKLKDVVFKKNLRKAKHVKEEIRNIVADLLSGGEELDMITVPSVILVIGVNGVGKTTSIGKMAAMFKAEGKKVILGAADTFRAAAIDQLEIWADRAGVDIVKHKEGADPAAVVFDTIAAGKARNADIIICDTAGRLQIRKILWKSLQKFTELLTASSPMPTAKFCLCLMQQQVRMRLIRQKNSRMLQKSRVLFLQNLTAPQKAALCLQSRMTLKCPLNLSASVKESTTFDLLIQKLLQTDCLKKTMMRNNIYGLYNCYA